MLLYWAVEPDDDTFIPLLLLEVLAAEVPATLVAPEPLLTTGVAELPVVATEAEDLLTEPDDVLETDAVCLLTPCDRENPGLLVLPTVADLGREVMMLLVTYTGPW